MIYGIDSFTVLEESQSVTFVRVGNAFGWYTHIDGKQYGDWLQISDKEVTPEAVVEAFSLLAKQAADTITKLEGLTKRQGLELAAGFVVQVQSAAKS